MATIDQKFIDRLDVFTESLGEIVVLLQEQAKKDNTDVVNKLLDKMDDDKIQTIVDEIKSVSKDIKDIKSDTSDIKKKIEDLKKQKEAGLFDKVSDPDNKKKIVDGIKVIGLIAGGVLAIGMAFKIVGKVDPISVLSLSVGIVAIAGAFVIVSESLKKSGADMKDIVLTATVIPIMAAALMVSSIILAGTSSLKTSQMTTLIGVSIAMGISLYSIGMAIESTGGAISRKNVTTFLIMPVILPAIAAGLMASSYLLEKTVAIPPVKLLTIGAIAAASGLALFLIAKSIDKLKLEKKDVSKFLLLPLILPAIAGGIVLSAWIFQLSPTIPPKQALSILLMAGVIGLSTLIMMPTIKIISKIKLKDAFEATILLPLVAGALVASAFILQQGGDLIGGYDSSKVPDPKYTLYVGLSMIVFGGAVFLLGKFLKPPQLIQGGIAVVGLAAIIMVSSLILSVGNYSKYPELDWSTGVGLSMLIFGGAVVGLGLIIMSGVGAVALILGAIGVLGVAGVMVAVAAILNTLDWRSMKYPTEEWAVGAGLSIAGFAVAMLLATPGALISSIFSFFGADPPLVQVAKNIVAVAEVLHAYDWTNAKYPTKEWAGGAGLAISLFALMDLVAAPAALIGSVFKFFGGDPPLIKVAKNIIEVAEVLSYYDWDSVKYPSKEWSEGVGKAISYFALMDLVSAPASLIDGVFSFFGAKPPLVHVANSMIQVAEELNKYAWSDMRYPTKEWSEGVGIAISHFSKMSIATAGASLVGKIFSFFGSSPPLETVATSMIEVAKELNKYDWADMKYPKKEWAEGVGGALSAFTENLKNLDEVGIRTKNFGHHSIKMVEGLKEIAEHLKGTEWGDIQVVDFSWVDPITEGIGKFIDLIDKVDEASYGRDDRKQFFRTVKLIPDVANILSNESMHKIKLPSFGWVDQASSTISKFIDLIDKVDEASYGRDDRLQFFKTVELISDVAFSLSRVPTYGIDRLAASLRDVSYVLSSMDTSGLDRLSKFSDNMLVLSMIDEAKLEDFIETIDDKRDELENIVSIGTMESEAGVGYQTEIINRHVVVKEDDDKKEEKERFERLMSRLEYMSSLYEQMLENRKLDNPDKITFGRWSESTHDTFS
jgi:hypothetical protein